MSRLGRRQVAAALLATPLLAGCERVLGGAADALQPPVPPRAPAPDGEAGEAAHHLLSRAAWGPRPGEAEAVAGEGPARWLERQLEPASIPDAACGLRARRFETVHLEPGTAYEFRPEVLRAELGRHTLLHAVYSERQLLEVLVAFWSDHFNIDVDKGDCLYFKATDDREVVRAHALGPFEALVRASVTSPAMLLYLDGASSVGSAPNENHARELLELHTLGVHGGYTQRDVREAARCLTGWRVRTRGWRRGSVWFDPAQHDDGPKRVLGEDVPAGLGAGDVDRLVAIACRHPSTARHLALKLARRFVSEDPPEALVDALAGTWSRSGGQLKPVLRALFASPAFAAARGLKLKTPFRLVASALRALGADTHAHRPLVEQLGRMGQPLFEFPTPDGYPQSADAQASSLLWRWSFAFALAQQRVATVTAPLAALDAALAAGNPGLPTSLERWAAHLTGHRHEPGALARLEHAVAALPGAGVAEQVALLLASPEFQRC